MTRRGQLLVGADWAIAHGDADGLAHVLGALACETSGETARELRELCAICAAMFPEAVERWEKLRHTANLAPPRDRRSH